MMIVNEMIRKKCFKIAVPPFGSPSAQRWTTAAHRSQPPKQRIIEQQHFSKLILWSIKIRKFVVWIEHTGGVCLLAAAAEVFVSLQYTGAGAGAGAYRCVMVLGCDAMLRVVLLSSILLHPQKKVSSRFHPSFQPALNQLPWGSIKNTQWQKIMEFSAGIAAILLKFFSSPPFRFPINTVDEAFNRPCPVCIGRICSAAFFYLIIICRWIINGRENRLG